MICDLCSPSSVYCCNRREVVPVWPLWLCGRDPARPHQASPAAHRSVWPPRPVACGPSVRSRPSVTCVPDFCKSLYLRVYWKFCLNRILIHLPLYIYEVGLLRVWGIRCPLSIQVKQEGKECLRILQRLLCGQDPALGALWGRGIRLPLTLASCQSVSPVFLLTLPLRCFSPAHLEPCLPTCVSASLTTWPCSQQSLCQMEQAHVVVGLSFFRFFCD